MNLLSAKLMSLGAAEMSALPSLPIRDQTQAHVALADASWVVWQITRHAQHRAKSTLIDPSV